MPSKPGYNKAHTMSTTAENKKVTIEIYIEMKSLKIINLSCCQDFPFTVNNPIFLVCFEEEAMF